MIRRKSNDPQDFELNVTRLGRQNLTSDLVERLYEIRRDEYARIDGNNSQMADWLARLDPLGRPEDLESTVRDGEQSNFLYVVRTHRTDTPGNIQPLKILAAGMVGIETSMERANRLVEFGKFDDVSVQADVAPVNDVALVLRSYAADSLSIGQIYGSSYKPVGEALVFGALMKRAFMESPRSAKELVTKVDKRDHLHRLRLESLGRSAVVGEYARRLSLGGVRVDLPNGNRLLLGHEAHEVATFVLRDPEDKN